MDTIYPEVITASLASILWTIFSWSFISILGSIIMLIWWAAKMKRDIDEFHNGDPWDYIKFFFNKHKK